MTLPSMSLYRMARMSSRFDSSSATAAADPSAGRYKQRGSTHTWLLFVHGERGVGLCVQLLLVLCALDQL